MRKNKVNTKALVTAMAGLQRLALTHYLFARGI